MSINVALREKLAAKQHEIWSAWMRWMFEQGWFFSTGTWKMPADKVERWMRQVNHPTAKAGGLKGFKPD